MGRKTAITPKPLGTVRAPDGTLLNVWEEDRPLNEEEKADLREIARQIDDGTLKVNGQ